VKESRNHKFFPQIFALLVYIPINDQNFRVEGAEAMCKINQQKLRGDAQRGGVWILDT